MRHASLADILGAEEARRVADAFQEHRRAAIRHARRYRMRHVEYALPIGPNPAQEDQ